MEQKSKREKFSSAVVGAAVADKIEYTDEIVHAMAEQAAVKIHGTLSLDDLYKKRGEIINMAANEVNAQLRPQTVADNFENRDARRRIMGEFIQKLIDGKRLDHTPPPQGCLLN